MPRPAPSGVDPGIAYDCEVLRMTGIADLSPEAQLRTEIDGHVITPDDAEYDAAHCLPRRYRPPPGGHSAAAGRR
jgi:hypothetical protein